MKIDKSKLIFLLNPSFSIFIGQRVTPEIISEGEEPEIILSHFHTCCCEKISLIQRQHTSEACLECTEVRG